MFSRRFAQLVSTIYEKCIKGRCGCGGSSFPRAHIRCDDANDCGGCGLGFGCNLGGSTLLFCDPRLNLCQCVNTVFHEMAHSCGALHTIQYYQQKRCVPGDPACAIGDWFQTERESMRSCIDVTIAPGAPQFGSTSAD